MNLGCWYNSKPDSAKCGCPCTARALSLSCASNHQQLHGLFRSMEGYPMNAKVFLCLDRRTGLVSDAWVEAAGAGEPLGEVADLRLDAAKDRTPFAWPALFRNLSAFNEGCICRPTNSDIARFVPSLSAGRPSCSCWACCG